MAEFLAGFDEAYNGALLFNCIVDSVKERLIDPPVLMQKRGAEGRIYEAGDTDGV